MCRKALHARCMILPPGEYSSHQTDVRLEHGGRGMHAPACPPYSFHSSIVIARLQCPAGCSKSWSLVRTIHQDSELSSTQHSVKRAYSRSVRPSVCLSVCLSKSWATTQRHCADRQTRLSRQITRG